MKYRHNTLFTALAVLAVLAVLSVPAAASDLSGHWASAGITEPGQPETTEHLDGFPVKFCAHYQLEADGTFEAVVFGAWFSGTWMPDGAGASLKVTRKAETEEYLPETLTLRDGRLHYKDRDGLAFRLERVEGKLDVDRLLEEIQAELE